MPMTPEEMNDAGMGVTMRDFEIAVGLAVALGVIISKPPGPNAPAATGREALENTLRAFEGDENPRLRDVVRLLKRQSVTESILTFAHDWKPPGQ